MDDDDILCRQTHALIGSSDCRIIPFRYAAQENSRKRFGSKVEAGVHPSDVVRRNDGAEDSRKVQKAAAMLVAVRLQLFLGHRAVGCAEIDCAIRCLFNSRSRTNGLIVNLNIAVGLVKFIEPF